MKHFAPFGDAVAQVDAIVTAKWSIPIIRLLLDGPARFTRLKDQLAGVSSNILTARLRDLEHRGIIQRITLPPPADCEVYGLTPRGLAAEPVVLAITHWSKSFEGNGERQGM
jgi:DNA-binding HxlR family transcriptional regulator